jgi:WD40 repeat protein
MIIEMRKYWYKYFLLLLVVAFITFPDYVCAQENLQDNAVLKLVPQTGHRGIIRSAIFSPDHKTIASGGDDGVIILWDAVTYEQKAIISGYSLPVVCMAFSPDGKLLATVGSGAELTIWDVKTRGKVVNLGKRGNSVQFSSDGSFIVLGSNDFPDKNNIIVWETKNWAIRNRFKSSFDSPLRIILSPDNRILAVVGSQTSVQDNGIYRGLDICDVNTGKVIKTIQNIKFDQSTLRMLFDHAITFSQTGEYLIEGIDAWNDMQTRTPRQKINIWNTATWEQQLLKESNVYYTDIERYNDSDKIAMMTMNKGINIWDLKEKNMVTSINSISSKDVVINPYFETTGNKIIAGGQGLIIMFDLVSGIKYEGFSEQAGIIKYVDFNKGASGITTQTRFKTETRFLNWHFGTGRPARIADNSDENIVNLDTDIKLKWNRNGALSIVPFPGRSNASIEFYIKNKYSSGNIVINTDQTILAAWKEVSEIALFDFSGGFNIDKLYCQQQEGASSIGSNIANVKISRLNHLIASYGNGNVQLWDINSKTKIFHFKVPDNQTIEFAISHDEKIFAYSVDQ